MTIRVRCQGAILQDHHILLIQHREHDSGRSYWLLPGDGQEVGEDETQCVRHEMQYVQIATLFPN
jgi:ADP-ribose pyrophosphatase YjhB (NUDIX family)